MKKLLVAALLCAAIIGYTGHASAHVVETDGSIGAVLHVDPDDDPVAGQESVFFFDFKDKTNRFSESNCTCRLIVEENGTVIYDELFNRASGGSYTFPSTGVYTVKAVGQSIKPGAFDNFSLIYAVRVERGVSKTSQTTKRSDKLLIVFILFAVSLFLFGGIRYKIVHSIK